MPTKILALASEPLSADVLRSARGEDAARDAEVLVVAPALIRRRRCLLADPDPPIERAEEVQAESVERLEEEGVDAHGETGESNPLTAIEDALAPFYVRLSHHPVSPPDILEALEAGAAQIRPAA